MTTTINPLIPTIPGITGVLGSISASAAWANLESEGETKELAKVADAPQVSEATAAFKKAISDMTSVNQLLNNNKALTYLMTAFGLGSDTSQMGIIKQVLTQDPSNTSSLVNKLAAPEWKTMATTLQTYATGLKTLQGDVVSQTFSAQSFSNQYLQVQNTTTDSYGVGSTAQSITNTQNFYTNNLTGLTIGSNGILQTAEGYKVMGLKLDNNGDVQPPAGASLVDTTTSVTDDKGNAQNVEQSFTNEGNGNWKWTVTDSSGDVLSQQNLALTFNADGTLATVNGQAATNSSGTGSSNQSVTLNWGDGGTTTQSFDLSQSFTQGFNQYQQSDLTAVQVSWFTNGNSPTNTITPNVQLSSKQPVADQTNVSSVVSIPSDQSGQEAAVTQSLSQNTDGTWNWTITNSDGTVLYNDPNAQLTFNSSGQLTAVNGNTNTSPTVTLNWADGGTTSQSFDLSSAFQTSASAFSQSVSVTDNIGTARNVTLDYSKVDASTDTWQVQVWDADTNTLAQTVQFSFNSAGTVTNIGTVDPTTGQVTPNTDPTSLSTNVSINWGSGYGASNISLNLSNLSDLGTTNFQVSPTTTDGVALGAYQSATISQSGLVSATYANASGGGTTTIPIYQLAVNSFSSPAGLQEYGTSGYLTASSASGTDTIQPLGTTDTDPSGNTISDQAGNLDSVNVKNGSSAMQTIVNDYDQNVYEEALGQENEALRYAVYFKQNAKDITSIDGLLGDGPSRDLVSTVFGISQYVAEQDLNEQESIFSSHVDVSKFQDSTYVNNLIQRFLAITDANSSTGGGTTATSPLASMLSTTVGGDNTDATSGLLSTVASNINILA